VFQQNFGGILVLDEIGCMELLSDRFKQEVKKAFSNPSITILAAIPARPLSFTESLRHSPNSTVIMVSSYDVITDSCVDAQYT
jgi:nucleoside-triphosphatase THEP1